VLHSTNNGRLQERRASAQPAATAAQLPSWQNLFRDYWDVELTAGGIYRIFRERQTGDWFADEVYD